MTSNTGSPYTRALGARRAELSPGLRRYFDTVPAGRVGIGEGVFESLGTPRRRLRPLLRPLHRHGAIWAGRAENVPFAVRNRTVAGRALAERVFHLPGGDWIMRDEVSLRAGGRLVDLIGAPAVLAVSFDAEVQGGALRLRSHAVGLRLCRLRIRIPRILAPRVMLTESHEEETGRQRVALRVDAPLLGRLYEYTGSFAYRIEEDG